MCGLMGVAHCITKTCVQETVFWHFTSNQDEEINTVAAVHNFTTSHPRCRTNVYISHPFVTYMGRVKGCPSAGRPTNIIPLHLHKYQSSTAFALGGWLFGGIVADTVFFSSYSGWWLFGASLVYTGFYSFHAWWLALWRSRRGHGLLQLSQWVVALWRLSRGHSLLQLSQLVVGSLTPLSWTQFTSAFTVGGGSLAACSRTQSSTAFTLGGWLFGALVVDMVLQPSQWEMALWRSSCGHGLLQLSQLGLAL